MLGNTCRHMLFLARGLMHGRSAAAGHVLMHLRRHVRAICMGGCHMVLLMHHALWYLS